MIPTYVEEEIMKWRLDSHAMELGEALDENQVKLLHRAVGRVGIKKKTYIYIVNWMFRK